MRCNKHKNYKGIKAPSAKRNCPECQKLYEEVNKAAAKYYSLTTPNFYCSIIHILAECMTLMLFGKQPPFFWRKDTFASFPAKKFFQNTFTYLSAQKKNHPEQIKTIEYVFSVLAYAEKRKIEAQKIYDKETLNDIIVQQKESAKTKPRIDVIESFLATNKSTKSKWSLLSKLEKKDGEKEEGR